MFERLNNSWFWLVNEEDARGDYYKYFNHRSDAMDVLTNYQSLVED